ncbi:MAG: hypothetical protein INR65_05245 [Gluconacetobacter diazotrophicus]|nr:hypothetical protein [Gluconacetobacter diazotrophicus]
MAKKDKKTAEAPPPAAIPAVQATAAVPVPDVVETTSAGAPFIYTDGAPNFGYLNGIVQVTLEAVQLQPAPDKPVTRRVVVGHLRMNVPGARSLIAALQGAVLLAERPAGPAN